MSALQPGDIVFLDYGGRPRTIHSRLVLAEVDRLNHEFVILTPDHDVYTEQLHGSNPDLVSYNAAGPGGAVPAGLPARSVYSFAPMSAQELARFMTAGRNEAAAERARRGAAAPAAPVAPAAPAAPGAPAAAQVG